MGGDAAVGREGYEPPPNFEENTKEALIDLDVTDSTELWLIQWPNNLDPDFDGKEVTLKLRHNGKLGSLEGSSGNEYELVSCAAPEPDATVFVPSLSSSKIVGKISRRVSLVHYPEPKELEKLTPQRSMYQMSSRTSLADGTREFSSPMQRTPQRSLLGRANSASTHGSRPKSDVSDPAERFKDRKRELANGPISDVRSNAKSSGHARGRSTTTISGSFGHNSSGVSSGLAESSHHKSSKKRKGGE